MTDFEPAVTGVRIFPDGRMTAVDASAYAGVSTKSLAVMRCAGTGPAFTKLGKRIFYAKADLDGWIASRRVNSTAEFRARRSAA